MERWKQLGALALFLGVGGSWVGWASCQGTPAEGLSTTPVEADVVMPSSKAFVPPADWEPPPQDPVVLPSSKAARPPNAAPSDAKEPVVMPSSKAGLPLAVPDEQRVLLPSSKAGAFGAGGSVEVLVEEIEVE